MRSKAVLSLWLVAFSAWAQQVVVMEFQADPGNRLGRQIENALWEQKTLMPMPLQTYRSEAMRAGVSNAQTGIGFSRVAIRLESVVVAVWGKIEGNSVEIVMWDRTGFQLWKRRLPLARGLLSEELSQRLAKAVVAAVEVQSGGSGEKAPEADEADETPEERLPTLELTAEEFDEADEAADEAADEEAGLWALESSGEAPPPAEVATPSSEFPARFVRLRLLGSASWRSLCAQAGRSGCIAFNQLSASAPKGNKAFSSGAYAGGALEAEYFPLAHWTRSAWKGLGLRLGLGYGGGRMDFKYDIDAFTDSTTLTLQELHWSMEALYAHMFLEPSAGGLGVSGALRLGYGGKHFSSTNVRAQGLKLPETRRQYLNIGVEAELFVKRFLRFDIHADIYIQPKPGKAVAADYGKAGSQGYKLGGGLSGQLYGPLGYRLEASWNFFKDRFKQASETWPQGGVLEERYFSLRGGLQVDF